MGSEGPRGRGWILLICKYRKNNVVKSKSRAVGRVFPRRGMIQPEVFLPDIPFHEPPTMRPRSFCLHKIAVPMFHHASEEIKHEGGTPGCPKKRMNCKQRRGWLNGQKLKPDGASVRTERGTTPRKKPQPGTQSRDWLSNGHEKKRGRITQGTLPWNGVPLNCLLFWFG